MKKWERLSQQSDKLKGEYRRILVKALTECSGGRWGLFGHNEHLRSSSNPPELEELRALAKEINRLRQRLGVDSFSLHDEFESERGRAQANAPGEPRKAQAWLQRLSAT